MSRIGIDAAAAVDVVVKGICGVAATAVVATKWIGNTPRRLLEIQISHHSPSIPSLLVRRRTDGKDTDYALPEPPDSRYAGYVGRPTESMCSWVSRRVVLLFRNKRKINSETEESRTKEISKFAQIICIRHSGSFTRNRVPTPANTFLITYNARGCRLGANIVPKRGTGTPWGSVAQIWMYVGKCESISALSSAWHPQKCGGKYNCTLFNPNITVWQQFLIDSARKWDISGSLFPEETFTTTILFNKQQQFGHCFCYILSQ